MQTGLTATTARSTRESLRSASAVTSTRAASDSMESSRRAFGDVSNRRANGSRAKDATKTGPEQQTLRRSRRLSREPNEERNPAEDDGVEGKTSLRASTKARTRKSLESSSEGLSTQATGERGRPPTRQRMTRSSVKKDPEESTQGRSISAKRGREDAMEMEEPPKKVAKRASRGRVSKAKEEHEVQHKADTGPKNWCNDILLHTDHGLVRTPFDDSKYTPGLSPYDLDTRDDVQEVPDYVTDIFQRLYDAESQTTPVPYMDDQEFLNGMMRAILVDWLVEVHMKFRLMPETLYLSINIIDRYLSQVQVERQKLQLVGVTALLIACKYEEIYPPEVKDCVYITDRAYTRQDVLDMETHIVKILQFKMTVPTGHPFLQRFLHVSRATKVMRNLASYYMERMLQEYSTLSYRPSLVAAAAVCLAINNPDALDYEGLDADQGPGIPESLVSYTGFSRKKIIEVSQLMAFKVSEETTTYSRRELVSVKKKYQADRYTNASSGFTHPTVGHLCPA
jgi:hypothetical protein